MHLRSPLTEPEDAVKGNDWEKVKRLFAIPGVMEAFLKVREVSLNKAPLFGWSALMPLAIQILEGKMEVELPSVSPQVAYRRVPNPLKVEFHTSFVVSNYPIDVIYPSLSHLKEVEKRENIGQFGIDILKSIAKYVGTKQIDHFFIKPYQISVETDNLFLSDKQCQKICSVIAKAARVEDCKLGVLPTVVYQPSVFNYHLDTFWSYRDYLDW